MCIDGIKGQIRVIFDIMVLSESSTIDWKICPICGDCRCKLYKHSPYANEVRHILKVIPTCTFKHLWLNCLFKKNALRELTDGIPVVDKNGNELGKSKNAAQSGITAVTISRVAMAAPGFGKIPWFWNEYYFNENYKTCMTKYEINTFYSTAPIFHEPFGEKGILATI